MQANAIVAAALAVTAGPAVISLRAWRSERRLRQEETGLSVTVAAMERESALPDDAALLLGDSPSSAITNDAESTGSVPGEDAVLRLTGWAEQGKRIRERQNDLYLRSLTDTARRESVTFWASLFAGLACLALIVTGVELAVTMKTQIGIVSAAASLLPAAFGKLLFSQSKIATQHAATARKALLANAERGDRISGLIGIAALIGDGDKRQRLIVLAALLQAFPQAKLQELEAMADRMSQ